MSEYKSLIKAIIDNGIIDYIKLQHPNNRKKRYLQEAYYTSIALFFDDSFRLDLFLDQDGLPLSLETALKIIVDGQLASTQKAREYLIKETIVYWHEKNFQNLSLPKTINIAGKTYFICNTKEENPYIDLEKYIFYLNFSKKEVDRDFTALCLSLILEACEINLKTRALDSLNKFFYLFLKINGCFTATTKQSLEDDSE
jgi:hypothetical protein